MTEELDEYGNKPGDFFYHKPEPKIPMELMDKVIKMMAEENPDAEDFDMGDIIERCREEMRKENREMN